MPFSTDESWPRGLIDIFKVCSDKSRPLENHLYGAYNRLLHYCFGDSFSFFVTPQHPIDDDGSKHTIDFIVFLIVFNGEGRPVLIAAIKEEIWLNYASRRLEADQQLRRRYEALLSDCTLPRLWGLSFLGTSVRFYHGDSANKMISPPYIGRPVEYMLPSSFLEGEWDVDILSQRGFNRMKQIVAEITAGAA